MFGEGLGKSTNDTAFANAADGGWYDPYVAYEDAFRASRQELAGGGKPTTLLTHLPANSAWWIGDGWGWGDVRLHRAASSVHPIDIATPDFERGLVLLVPGPYTSVANTRPNEWALVDPTDDYAIGDVPIWSQEAASAPGNYYEYDALNGGW